MENKIFYALILLLFAATNARANDFECSDPKGSYIDDLDTTQATYESGKDWYDIVNINGLRFKVFNLPTENSYSLTNESGMGKILHVYLLFALSGDKKVVLEDDTLRGCQYGFTQVKVLFK